MDNNQQTQSDTKKYSDHLIALMNSIEALYNDDYYIKAAEIIKDQFVLANDKFFDKDGKLIEDYWQESKQTFQVNGKTWKVKIFVGMLRINVLGRDVLFTLARVVPPLEYKQVLNSGNEQSEEFKKVSNEYVSDLLSMDSHLLRVGVAIILNDYVFKDKDYSFAPMKEVYGLLPQYDNDTIVSFVSVKSLKGELN